MVPLRDIVFADQKRLLSFYQQLVGAPRVRFKRAVAGVQTPFARAEAEVEGVDRTPESYAHILDTVLAGLRESGQLAAVRPQNVEDYEQYLEDGLRYVAESRVRASLVSVPVAEELRASGLPATVKVWVADPDRLPIDPKPFEWEGTFLYLVEDLPSAKPTPGFWCYSGASALAQVARLASTADAPLRAKDGFEAPDFFDEDERLGRGSDLHPLQKLESLGAHVSLPRHVDVLYEMRYMTNEQLFVPPGATNPRRVHDLAAYPLAIWIE